MSTIMADTAFCLARLVQHEERRGHSVSLGSFQCSSITVARNSLVEQALRFPSISHVLFIDSDQTFPPNTLERLMSRNKDVVAPMCPRRAPPYDLVGKLQKGADISRAGIQPAEVVPHGIVLIKRSVFERIPKPWYIERFDTNLITEDDPLGVIGEDVNFSQECLNANIEMYCDIALTKEIGHIGNVTFFAN